MVVGQWWQRVFQKYMAILEERKRLPIPRKFSRKGVIDEVVQPKVLGTDST